MISHAGVDGLPESSINCHRTLSGPHSASIVGTLQRTDRYRSARSSDTYFNPFFKSPSGNNPIENVRLDGSIVSIFDWGICLMFVSSMHLFLPTQVHP